MLTVILKVILKNLNSNEYLSLRIVVNRCLIQFISSLMVHMLFCGTGINTFLGPLKIYLNQCLIYTDNGNLLLQH